MGVATDTGRAPAQIADIMLLEVSGGPALTVTDIAQRTRLPA